MRVSLRHRVLQVRRMDSLLTSPPSSSKRTSGLSGMLDQLVSDGQSGLDERKQQEVRAGRMLNTAENGFHSLRSSAALSSQHRKLGMCHGAWYSADYCQRRSSNSSNERPQLTSMDACFAGARRSFDSSRTSLLR